jgi:hypothetical protein
MDHSNREKILVSSFQVPPGGKLSMRGFARFPHRTEAWYRPVCLRNQNSWHQWLTGLINGQSRMRLSRRNGV